MGVPPPVLMKSRVLQYAILGPRVGFSGHTDVFVGQAEDLKELGRVPALAIGESLDSRTRTLFYCGRDWSVRAWIDGYSTIRAAKRRAEGTYPGVRSRWRNTGVSRSRARQFLKKMWEGWECSFCRRLPDTFERLVKGTNAQICDRCIRECHEFIDEPKQR
jgi:hypothetical protein